MRAPSVRSDPAFNHPGCGRSRKLGPPRARGRVPPWCYGWPGMGVPRERMERIERDVLSEHAVLSVATKGRERVEDPHPLRTAFQTDRDRIVNSKAFRRLKHKTQVFLAP